MKLLVAVLLMALSFAAVADTYVRGYTKKNGTYVEPHYRSSPNSTTLDNYSTKGNTNPYTGEPGYKSPEPSNNYQYQQPKSNSYDYNNNEYK